MPGFRDERIAGDLDELADLFEQTSEYFRSRAAQSVNREHVMRNWMLGRYIVEYEQGGQSRAAYGTTLLRGLSERLKKRGFRGGSLSSLKQIRAFYLAKREISQTVSGLIRDGQKGQTPSGLLEATDADIVRDTGWDALAAELPLSWSHYVALLTIDDSAERQFYEIESSCNGWSLRELQRHMDSALYQRLALSRDKEEIRRLAIEGQVVAKAADLIRNPFVLEFLELEERAAYSESELEAAIIEKLQVFMLELGKGFLFECRQKRFTFDDKHYRVDLVLYNRLLRCYVLLDLKLGEITHGDLGQMQMYVNYYNRHVKLDDELPTIGIVLCARKNDALVELTLPEEANIFAAKYQLYLPSKEELERELERIDSGLHQAGKNREHLD